MIGDVGGWVVGASLYASVPIEIFDHRPTFRARLMSFFQLNGFTAIDIRKCGTVYFVGTVCYMFPFCMGTITLAMQKESYKLETNTQWQRRRNKKNKQRCLLVCDHSEGSMPK